MRKILVLGLLALFFSSISTLLFAGYEACDADRENLQAAGVYGWCNAWFSAETQDDKDRIAERIEQRVAESGVIVELDWLVTEDPECPCWTPEDLGGLTAGFDLAVGCYDGVGEGFVSAAYVISGSTFEVAAGYYSYLITDPDGTECVTVDGGALSYESTTPEEDALCREYVQALHSDFTSCF